MYLAVDMGGTKVLMALFDDKGNLIRERKFPTAQVYQQFLNDFQAEFNQLAAPNLKTAGIAIPAMIDRDKGVAIHFGNLDWENVPIRTDLEAIVGCPVVLENDAKVGAIFQAFNVRDEFDNVLYIAVGTGIGVAYTSKGILDTKFGDDGGRSIMIQQNGTSISWDHLASGKAIVKQFGQKAADITDEAIWKIIAHNLALGLIQVLTVFKPEIIIFGGGVGAHLDRFGSFLTEELKQASPNAPVPVIRTGVKPEEAVVYGAYQLARQRS